MSLLVATDGSCLRNRPGGGPTGWAYAFENGDYCAGGLLRGTNQVGELMGVFMLLRNHPSEDLTIQTDSTYVIGCCEKWKRAWQRRGYVGRDGQPLSNLKLIIPIHHMLDTYTPTIEFVKVPGHDPQNRYPLNTRADHLARQAAIKAKDEQNEVLLVLDQKRVG